jgi:predicted O-methyltransferase YrrM
VVVVDNVVRDGRILDPKTTSTDVQGVQKFFAMFTGNERLDATALQTVGNKGWDGFLLALVK